MKIKKSLLNTIVLGFLLYNMLYASIDEEIEAIQQAPIEQRFKLMNALKKKIVQMKEEKRMTTIKKLQGATQGVVIESRDKNMTTDQNSTESFKNKIESHAQDIIENHSNTIFEEQGHDGDD